MTAEAQSVSEILPGLGPREKVGPLSRALNSSRLEGSRLNIRKST